MPHGPGEHANRDRRRGRDVGAASDLEVTVRLHPDVEGCVAFGHPEFEGPIRPRLRARWHEHRADDWRARQRVDNGEPDHATLIQAQDAHLHFAEPDAKAHAAPRVARGARRQVSVIVGRKRFEYEATTRVRRAHVGCALFAVAVTERDLRSDDRCIGRGIEHGTLELAGPLQLNGALRAVAVEGLDVEVASVLDEEVPAFTPCGESDLALSVCIRRPVLPPGQRPRGHGRARQRCAGVVSHGDLAANAHARR